MGNDEWRVNTRATKSYNDIGYAIQDVIDSHSYRYDLKGDKPDDPGWHECSCGWEGYWAGFNNHVTNCIREVVVKKQRRSTDFIVHYRNLAIELGAKPEDMLNRYDHDLCANWNEEGADVWYNDQPEIWEELLEFEKNHSQKNC